MSTRDQPRPVIGRVQDTTAARTASVAWPLAVLLVGSLLLTWAAYAFRPTSQIDIGGRYDAPYLAGAVVHDREFGAVAPMHTYDWPQGSDTATLDSEVVPAYSMATLTVDPFTPDAAFPRRLISVYADGIEVANFADTGETREFRTLLPRGSTNDGAVTLRAITIPDRNSVATPPLQVESVTLAGANTYRWTSERSIVRLPGLGRGDWRVTMRTIVYHPNGQAVNARLYANDTLIANLPDYAGTRVISAIVPAAVMRDGELTLALEATPFKDPRPLGVLLEEVTVSPLGGTTLASTLPPLHITLPLLVVVVSLYGGLRRARVPSRWAAGTGLVLALALAAALVVFRYPMAFYLRPLAIVVLLGAALALLADWLFALTCRRLKIELAPWLRHTLLLIFLVSFWLKAGGLVFPYMQGHDIAWHIDWVRRLISGDVSFGQLYGTNSPLNELTMPVDEWGANRPVIPYAPFFQFFALSFTLLPWKPETTSDVLSALLDSSRVFFMALITLKAGLSNRATLLAALLYAILPATFLLLAWGNAPTTVGMWWALLTTTIILVGWEHLHRPGPFVGLTVATLGTLLFYTVMAAFHGLFIIILSVIILFLRKRFNTRPLVPMLLASSLALGISLLVYYGQYIMPILTNTVPYLATVFTRGSEAVGVERPSLGVYLLSYVPSTGYFVRPNGYVYYGLWVPLLAVLPGFFMLRDRHLLWAALSAWFTVALIFMVAGFRISMVDKQIFYMLPAVCICAAVVFERLWLRGRPAQWLIGGLYVFTLGTALYLWILRISVAQFGYYS